MQSFRLKERARACALRASLRVNFADDTNGAVEMSQVNRNRSIIGVLNHQNLYLAAFESMALPVVRRSLGIRIRVYVCGGPGGGRGEQ